MILNPAVYSIAAGGPGSMPGTALWWPPRRMVRRRMATPEELAGLGNFFHKLTSAITSVVRAPIKLISPKLADNLKKIDDKVLNVQDKVSTKINDTAHSVGKFISKNWKWIAVVAAIAITIYTMGSGATIAAKMLSGMHALEAHVAAGASSAWHAVVGTSAATTGTATAAASGSSWLATTGKLALSAATALQNKAKVSDLSQQQAQAMLAAQAAGYDLGASDPQLQGALQQRAAIPGNGIPTDANGNPLVEAPAGMFQDAGPAPLSTLPAPTPISKIPLQPAVPGAGSAILPQSTPIYQLSPSVPGMAPNGPGMVRAIGSGYPTGGDPLAAMVKSPYFVPVAIGAGALLLVLLLR
ncbi:MAG TPA: hypothetical protein VF768_11760 [Holophagaceae bacterium]